MASNEQELITKIAKLAQIHIKENEITEYSKGIAETLSFIEKINEINTDKVAPMSHPIENSVQLLRADEVSEDNKVDKLQGISPKSENNFYLVPNVMTNKN